MPKSIDLSQIYLDVDDQFGWWFSGYVDGEGSFMLTKRMGKGHVYTPHFSIGSRWDDFEIVEDCRRRLGYVGKVRSKPPRMTSGYQTRAYHEWQVRTARELVSAILPVLDKYPLRSRKKRQYDFFRRAVLLLVEKQDSGVKEYSTEMERELDHICRVLHEIKKPNTPIREAPADVQIE